MGVLRLLVAAILLVNAAVAHADHAPPLVGAITDAVDAVPGPDEARAGAALEQLLQEHEVQLRALFVGSTGGEPVTAYADRAARESSLGGNDGLLVVAVQDRAYALWLSDTLRRSVTRDEVDMLLVRDVEPRLRAGDWAGAIERAASSVGDASAGDLGRRTAAGGGLMRLLLGVALVAGAGWAITSWLRRRRQRAALERRLEHLAADANAALIATDEQLVAAERELAVTRAPDETRAAYEQAVLLSRERLRHAFELRARLDDGEPDPPAERERLFDGILAECAHVRELLAPPQQRLRELREREAEAPDVLAALPGRADEVAALVEPAERTLDDLRRTAPGHVATVEGNPVEARKRLEYARVRVSEGLEAVERGDGAEAAAAAAEASEAVDRAAQLVASVSHLDGAVADARLHLASQLRSAEADVAAAAEVAAGDERISRARALLTQATAVAVSDPLTAHRLAVEADGLAEEVRATRTRERERDEQARRVLDTALQSAEATYEWVADFVAARREGVGPSARARLHRARSRLERAWELAESSPERALTEARRAEGDAREAYELAADDVDRFESQGRAYGGVFGMGMPLPIPLPIPILIGGGGGWGGPWGTSTGGGWSSGGGWGGGGSSGGTW